MSIYKKTDLLPKFESLKCNSFGFIQNIILLQRQIHEQYFYCHGYTTKYVIMNGFKKA
jgi:hypothetical protein